MNHVHSSCDVVTRPYNKNLNVPRNKTEFQALTYFERCQLQEEHPAIYKKYADREGRWSWED